jgi:hypothetical protein
MEHLNFDSIAGLLLGMKVAKVFVQASSPCSISNNLETLGFTELISSMSFLGGDLDFDTNIIGE